MQPVACFHWFLFLSHWQKKKNDSDDESDVVMEDSEDEFDAMVSSKAAPREKPGRRAATKVNQTLKNLRSYFNPNYFAENRLFIPERKRRRA